MASLLVVTDVRFVGCRWLVAVWAERLLGRIRMRRSIVYSYALRAAGTRAQSYRKVMT